MAPRLWAMASAMAWCCAGICSLLVIGCSLAIFTPTVGCRAAGYDPNHPMRKEIMPVKQPSHRTVKANGIHIHLAEQGTGPLVLLCHGFPESWYSWRHQLSALADAGFRAVAADMRGYGGTDRPEEVEQYTLFHLIGDIVGLLGALGAERAVIVGHDWGAAVAWHAALMRPDLFRGVIGLSVPFRPRGPVRPTTVMPQTEEQVFYQLYFQTPDVPEAELECDIRRFIRGVLYSNSGDF